MRTTAATPPHLASLGEPSERLDAQAMHRPDRQPPLCLRPLHARHGDAATGGLYPRVWAKGSRGDGVGVCERHPSPRSRAAAAGWTLTTPQGKVSAGKVILANNGHLESFGFAENRLMHVFLLRLDDRELPRDALTSLGGQPRWGVTPSDPMGTTMRRIDTAWAATASSPAPAPVSCPGWRPQRPTLRRTARVIGQVRRPFPDAGRRAPGIHLGGAPLPDAERRLDRARAGDGLFAATVCNGLGTARGTLTGIAAAERVMGLETEVTRHFDAEVPPTKLPPKPFSTIGANIFLRFGRSGGAGKSNRDRPAIAQSPHPNEATGEPKHAFVGHHAQAQALTAERCDRPRS